MSSVDNARRRSRHRDIRKSHTTPKHYNNDTLPHELVDSAGNIIKKSNLTITERDKRNYAIAGSGFYWRSLF